MVAHPPALSPRPHDEKSALSRWTRRKSAVGQRQEGRRHPPPSVYTVAGY